MPKLKRQKFAKAKLLIKLAGCAVGNVAGPKSHSATRLVVNQNPRPNKNVPAGTKINVQIR